MAGPLRAFAAGSLALLVSCTSTSPPSDESGSPAGCALTSAEAGVGTSKGGLQIGALARNGRLAFAAAKEPGGQLDLYVGRGDGSSPTAIAAGPRDEYSPAWSPDGARIAYRVNRSGEYAPDIWVMNADGSDKRNLTRTPTATEWSPAWSPDGSRIAYYDGSGDSGGGGISTMTPNGTGRTDLTGEGSAGASNEYPSWSPDGARIAYIHYTLEGDFEIWAMNADGSCQIDLTNDPGADEWPTWSPDGGTIAFMSSRDGIFGAGDIFVMEQDGSSPTNLTRTRRVNESFPAWTPDGRIGFVRYLGRAVSGPNETSAAEIWVMNADGSNPVRLGFFGYELGPMAWTPVS